MSHLRLVCILACLAAITATAAAAKPNNQGERHKQPATRTAMPDLADYRQKVADAQAAVDAAQKALSSVVDQLTAKFEASDEWKQVQAAIKQAAATRDTALEAVMAKLSSNPEYAALVDAKAKAAAKVQQLRADPKHTPEQMTDALNASLAASTTVSQRESVAINSDDAARQAVANFTDAGAKAAAMKKAFLDSIKSSAELKSAQQALADAKAKRDQAQSDLNDAELRAEQASAEDAAAEKHRQKQPTTHGGGHSGHSGRVRIHIPKSPAQPAK